MMMSWFLMSVSKCANLCILYVKCTNKIGIRTNNKVHIKGGCFDEYFMCFYFSFGM